MQILIVSDLHLGKGRFFKNGQLNILEDFSEDERFEEFLDYYCSGKRYWADIHLILNGDILNLIHVDHYGAFTHIIDEEITVQAVNAVYEGHKDIFLALKKFANSPNKKISYVIGNHDAGMVFKGAQQRFCELLATKVDFAFEMNLHGVHIEHGHRFEVVDAIPAGGPVIKGPNGKKILNLPWGSLFCIYILPRLKKERPYLDKIRPIASYIKWCVVNDLRFFIRMLSQVLYYFIETRSSAYTKQNRHFKTSIKLLKQITIFPRYAKMARKIFSDRPNIHTVVMGHSHITEWRRFPEGKFYFNTGTWNIIPSVDAGLHQNVVKLNYVFLDLHPKSGVLKDASMNVWQGEWKPYRQDFSMPR